MPYKPVQLPASLLVASLLAGIACGGNDSLTPPTVGTIEVRTSTTGTEPDPDGYTIQVDGDPPQAVGSAASLQIAELEPGSHTVHLAGVSPNCTVAENPLTASVTAGETVAVDFAVTCEATTGSLRVTSTTTGPSPDADGYTVTVDGAERGPLGTSAEISVDALATGNHVVGLSGVAGNCQVQGDNPQIVAVTGGAAATVAFAVTCIEPPPSAGALQITTATTGPDPDPNGYTIAVDGGAAQPIGVNGSASLTNLAQGGHTVQLGGLATNCSAQGTNPRAATVTAGATAAVSFAITCTATSGTIRVTVTTTGAQLDEVYTAKVDGTGTGKRVEANKAMSFSQVPAGSHTVVLSDVATNCSVAEGLSRSTTVAAGGTVDVSFAITCSATTGTIRVNVTASGSPPDPDGFTVKLDQDGTKPILESGGSAGSATFSAVTPGDHDVVLTGLATNCSAPDGAAKKVTVQAGVAAEVAFTVTCSTAGAGWSSIELPPGFQATALWASSSISLFVAGAYPGTTLEVAILYYDGSKWFEQFRGRGTNTAAFGGSANDGLVAVTGSPMVLEHDLGEWVDVGPNNESARYESVWPSSGQIVAGGSFSGIPENGVLSHYNGTAWTLHTPGHDYGTYGVASDLSGTSPGEVYALGQTSPYSAQDPEEQFTDYLVSRFDGSTWTTVRRNRVGALYPDYPLFGLWAIAPNDVFVVGSAGHIDRYNGTAWAPMTSPITGNLADVWGNSPSNVYAVGEAGVLHYDGNVWNVINPAAASRVWGTPEEVFVLTQNAVLYTAHPAP